MAYAVIAGLPSSCFSWPAGSVGHHHTSIAYFPDQRPADHHDRQRFHYALNSFPLVAVPVFIFAGNQMNTSSHTNRMSKFADDLVGRINGRLAQVNIFASLIFSGISGAALADVETPWRHRDQGYGGEGLQQGLRRRGHGGFRDTVGPIFPPQHPPWSSMAL